MPLGQGGCEFFVQTLYATTPSPPQGLWVSPLLNSPGWKVFEKWYYVAYYTYIYLLQTWFLNETPIWDVGYNVLLFMVY